jgi:hypothetical protein
MNGERNAADGRFSAACQSSFFALVAGHVSVQARIDCRTCMMTERSRAPIITSSVCLPLIWI